MKRREFSLSAASAVAATALTVPAMPANLISRWCLDFRPAGPLC